VSDDLPEPSGAPHPIVAFADALRRHRDQVVAIERDLRESLRSGYFGEEPVDAAGLRLVRAIQRRLADLPCVCVGPKPAKDQSGPYRCAMCGGRR
jgi:hypothetical protein